jgi:hypothetical protein
MKKTILKYGLISGAIVSAFMATSMAIMGCSSGNEGNMTLSMVIGFSSMIAAFSLIYVGIKRYRDRQNGGLITFGRAFFIGLMISLIASTMYVLTWGVEFHYFLPDFMDKFTAIQVKEIQSGGLPADQAQKAIAEAEEVKHKYSNNIFFFAMFTYMEILPVGILITLISALILKRRPGKQAVAG